MWAKQIPTLVRLSSFRLRLYHSNPEVPRWRWLRSRYVSCPPPPQARILGLALVNACALISFPSPYCLLGLSSQICRQLTSTLGRTWALFLLTDWPSCRLDSSARTVNAPTSILALNDQHRIERQTSFSVIMFDPIYLFAQRSSMLGNMPSSFLATLPNSHFTPFQGSRSLPVYFKLAEH
jgi:hypothetical protein